MSQITLILTGTGRCATGFYAKLLREIGVPCGHEKIFDLGGLGPPEYRAAKQPHLVADSSWLAAPHLDEEWLDGVTVAHLVRHPKLYIDSDLKLNPYTATHTRFYLDYARKYLPTLDYYTGFPTKSAHRWVEWNRMVERKSRGRVYFRFDVAREPVEFLEELERTGFKLPPYGADELYDNREHNTKVSNDKNPWDVNLIDIDAVVRTELFKMMERYGYEWSYHGQASH